MKWNVSPNDVAKGKLIQKPGWFQLEIVDYKEELTAAKDSTNAIFDFRIHSDDKDANGIEIRVWFNEKAPAMAVPFMKALGAEEREDGSMSVEFGKHLIGQRVMGFVSRGTYKEKPVNKIDEYTAVS